MDRSTPAPATRHHSARRRAAMCLGLAAACVQPVLAQPVAGCATIKVVTPYGTGGPMDSIARRLAEQYRKSFGQTVLVENKPGAGGVLGSTAVMRAAPDGCTVLFTNSGAMVVQSVLKSPRPYDPTTSFTPIAKIADAPTYIGVPGSLPVNSLGELIALARSKPGTLSYTSPGVGSFGHFVGEYLKLQTGIDMVHVPGNSNATINDLIAGRIQVMIDPSVVPQRAGGRVKVLAVTSSSRVATYPDIPTAKESGGPDLPLVGWFGVVGPARMPKELVERFEAASRAMVDDPEARKAIERFGIIPAPESGAALGALIPGNVRLYGDIKTRANININ